MHKTTQKNIDLRMNSGGGGGMGKYKNILTHQLLWDANFRSQSAFKNIQATLGKHVIDFQRNPGGRGGMKIVICKLRQGADLRFHCMFICMTL